VPEVEITRLSLSAPHARLGELRTFYGERLGLPATNEQGGAFGLALKRARLVFVPAEGAPFHHFAMLIAGDRFDAAVDWAADRAELLLGAEDEPVFDFSSWSAKAVYFLDPAGNIVELIAHTGIGESGLGRAPFQAGEIVGISEAGLVVDDLPAVAHALHARAGLVTWDGDPAGGIAFLGRRAHTLILNAPQRGWLPTRRPAEPHPVTVTMAGPRGEIHVVADGTGAVQVRRTAA
jgi:hypothetical protein